MVKHQIILAMDVACGPCSVAVWKGGRVAAYAEAAGVTQSTRLLPLIEQVLKESGYDYKDLTAVTCTTGPGSFTGIRTGLATARGICLATGLPGLGFTTLETMALGQSGLAALNAGKGEYYYQSFKEGSPLSCACLGILKETADITDLPRADMLARLAAEYPERATALAPFYIRPPDAKPLAKQV